MSETTAPAAPTDDVRPIVRTAGSSNRGLWIFGGGLLLAALLLFQALEARRQELTTAPQTQALGTGSGTITAPPPLALPQAYAAGQEDFWPAVVRSRLGPGAALPTAPVQPQVVTRVVERPVPVQPQPPLVSSQPNFVPQPTVVFGDPAQGAAAAASIVAPGGERVEAGRLLKPSFTVPKGTVIAAVLETALDSTRPGAARAVVSRDVLGFDGTRVLVPRGSRLYGEYASEVSPGQKRALIHWQRLTRPDGVIINLDSPSADPLGRAGVRGKVDSHFFARFGPAILQSVLDIGVGLATSSDNDDTVIVGFPGSTQQITAAAQQSQIQPTLRVRQGTSVSVFVARDLDFSSVDR